MVGKYISVDRPNKFVQTWKLKSPTWPDSALDRIRRLRFGAEMPILRFLDHEGTLTATLNQQSDSTKLVIELSGVPKGQEDEIERNLTGY